VKEIASGIDEVYLGDLIEYASGQVDPKLEPYSKMPLVAPNHIESNTGKILKIETAEEQHAISGKYFFREGNVVYSKIRPSLNKVIIANFDGLCSADMYPITPKDKRISTRFLYYLLTSRIFVDYATRESVRTSIPKLNRTAMSKFKFAYMQPAKQAEFVQKLSTIDETIDSNLINIEETKNLLSQLIDRAMGGASDV
jgi:type I restriction enzyme S subunit